METTLKQRTNAYWEALVDKLREQRNLEDAEFVELIGAQEASSVNELLAQAADEVRRQAYGRDVYVRGLIEFTNYCHNNCYYCGIRAGNAHALRYRLTKEEILACCQAGYDLGFRTFVLQGGEDPYFTDERICDLVGSIREAFPECAITLSIGEKDFAAYKAYKAAGADRYLLRHETAGAEHYGRLHPSAMSLENRKRCLGDLKALGYQVGAGFMVGSPYQSVTDLVSDIRFLQELQPAMIGIGPFIHHPETPFAAFPNGSVNLTLRLLSLLRLCFPYALLPATTALASLAPRGRELGLQAGANVLMPNLSPALARQQYQLYSHKAHTGLENAHDLKEIAASVAQLGYQVVVDRGDAKHWQG